MTTLRICRLPSYPGPDLVIHGSERVVAAFFSNDPSGAFGLDGGEPNQVTTDDVRLINTVMRARTSAARWLDLTTAGELPWLARIKPLADLIEEKDSVWNASLRSAAETALREAVGSGRGRSVATKILHLKRPALFPILDALVIQQLGVPTDGGPEPIFLLDHLRAEGRRNLSALREIQQSLSSQFGRRPLIRILDVILWATHPAASIAPHLKAWTRTFDMVDESSQ